MGGGRDGRRPNGLDVSRAREDGGRRRNASESVPSHLPARSDSSDQFHADLIMVKREIERTVQPSILDRLTDTEPRVSADPRTTYAESLRAFKVSVQRDLEWLLNTRRTPRPAPDEFVELQNSLYNYGVPDITSLSSDSP